MYLVFASLIIPALATAHLQGSARTLSAYLIGAVAYALGVCLSALLDLPTGALTVWMMALVGTPAGFAIGRAVATRVPGSVSAPEDPGL